MAGAPIDFASVQWARRRAGELDPLLALSDGDLKKLAALLDKLAELKAAGVTPTDAQLNVLLQYLHTRNLDRLEVDKGGLFVQFSGAGYEYERFLLRDDGRMPNNRYESKRAS